MRKGFTRKPQADEPAAPVKNYITPSGLQRLKDEHRFLLTRERPAVTRVVAWAASNGDRSENADYQYGKRRLRQIDGRIRFLTKRIDAAEVVDPERPRSGQAAMRAFFGATVRYANAEGTERVVSIVGTDEVDLDRDHISWVSPLARALMKSAAGDRVVLQAPGGTEHLIVLEVRYERIPVKPFRVPPGAEASATELPADTDKPDESLIPTMSRMSPLLRLAYEHAQSSAKINRSGAMKYILMMNTPERGPYSILNWPRKDFEAHIAYWKSLNTELENLGELVAVEALTGPDQAKLVRAGKNGTPVTDGVFPESKEFLAGYWIVDVESPERAYEIAAHASAAPGPGGAPLNMAIEVRQVMTRRPDELS